ncbi:MAG: Protein-tyrosine-phosphatase, partial [Bacillota bacterium]|nr:Protein-tyrosine-phosphatase [Bacillota bacterium]
IKKKRGYVLIIDIHSHILPDLDDGAKDMMTAIQMLTTAAAKETTIMIGTPHVIEGNCPPVWQDIVHRCNLLQTAAQKAGLIIALYPGAEVALQLDILEKIKGPGDYCINGGRYLLVELPSLDIPSYTEEFFFRLQVKGIIPILAHPERHPVLARQPEILVKWVKKGILAQMNGTSILGRWGERVQKTAELFLVNRLIQFVGSDAHNTRTRHPDLQAARCRVIQLVGEDRAEQLFTINTLHVLQNLEVRAGRIDSLVYPSSSGLWTWLFKKLTGS